MLFLLKAFLVKVLLKDRNELGREGRMKVDTNQREGHQKLMKFGWGEGVENGQKLVDVNCEWPLSAFLRC